MVVRRDRDLRILVASLDFIEWLLPTTTKRPRHIRITFVNPIDNLTLDVFGDLGEARCSRDKGSVPARANLRPNELRELSRLCHPLGYLPNARCEHATRCVNDVGSMPGGWVKQ